MKRLIAVAAVVAFACAAAVFIIQADDDAAPAEADLRVSTSRGPLPLGSIEMVMGEDPDELLGSRPASPVYKISPANRRGPFVLRFAIPAGVDPEHLAIATRELEGDMWTLRAGRVAGGEFVIRTPTLSFWQLRDLKQEAAAVFHRARQAAHEFVAGISETLGLRTQPARCAGSAGDHFLTKTDAHHLLNACLETDGERIRIRVANDTGLGLEFGVSDELTVEETKGGSLVEAAWAEINRRLSADTAAILPGAGAVAISFTELPQEVSFRPTSSAFWIELGLAPSTRGLSDAVSIRSLADWAECVYAITEGNGEVDLGRFKENAVSLWAECGQAFAGTPAAVPGAALFDVFKLGRGAFDLRHLGHSAHLRVDRRTAGTEAKLNEMAEQGASCGVVEERFLATGSPVSVMVGVIGGRLLCEEARSVVSRFITTNECVDSGNTCLKRIDDYGCAAPTQGSYPRAIDCSARDLRIVGIDTEAVTPIDAPTSCGTPARVLPPGPYEVEANVPCQGAQALALQLTNVPCIDSTCKLLPFTCETKATGYESARHRCRFGRVKVAFSSGA
jgi:hypothetical protein